MAQKFTRTYTEEERVNMVREALEYGSNIVICKKYNLSEQLFSKWKSNYLNYGKTIKPKDQTELTEPKEVNYKKEYKKSQDKIKDLELEVAILKDLLKKKN